MIVLRAIGACVVALLLAGPVGCTMSTEAESGLPSLTEGQRIRTSQMAFTDAAGRRWVSRGEVSYRDASLHEVEEETFAVTSAARRGAESYDIATMPLERAAKLLAPHLEAGGVEFGLDEPEQLEFVRYVRQAAIENRDQDARGLSGASGAPAPEGGRIGQSRQAIVVDGPSWSNINSLAASWPYNMHGWGGTTSSPWCTCFKMLNEHTCITSAHCQHDGTNWVTRHPITFQAGSSSPRATISAGCYARSVPGGWIGSANPDFDYAVIAFRGLAGAACTTSSYSTGWFGWNTVGNGETGIGTWVSGYPHDLLPPSSTYPTLSFDWRNATYQPTSANAQLYHRCDTEGGSSGTAIIKTWSSSDYRALGVHRGPNGLGENFGPRMTTGIASWMGTVAGF